MFHLALLLLAAVPQGPDLRVEVEGGRTSLRIGSGPALHTTAREVQGARVVDVPGTDALIVLWDERAEDGRVVPHYRVRLPDGRMSRVRETSYELLLKWGDFDPLAVSPSFADSPFAPGAAGASAGGLYLVQFVTQPLEIYRAEIRALGGRILRFAPRHAYVVELPGDARGRVAALPFVRWVGPFRPDFRLEIALLDGLRTGALTATLRYNVEVFEKGPAHKRVVAAAIERMGGTVEGVVPDGHLLEATLTPAQLREVVTWDEVAWVDRWSPAEVDMNLVRIDGGANYLEAQTGFTGEGVRGEVLDTNVFDGHVDFQSNPILFHGLHGGDADHGTSTTGIAFGDGTGNPNGRGLLPDAQPIFAAISFLSNRALHTQQLLQAPYFAVFQSNSWGSGLDTDYNSTSRDMDDILFDNDIVVFQSQSNAGSQLSRPEAWAKNIVSVGGIFHLSTLDTSDDRWAGGASIGPAADGRVKPDMHYWYDNIFTCAQSGGYRDFCCTSAATPTVAGHAGLFFQMWHAGIFGNTPSGMTVFESRTKASTARAALINTAQAYTFSGLAHDRTRTHQGWGRPDLEYMYDMRAKLLFVDETEVLRELESFTQAAVVEPGEPELRATLVYLDPSGTTSASQHRINDLSLRLTAPDGTAYWGNNGLLAGNWSTAGGASNTIDVVENVLIQSPLAGAWTIQVFADEINQDAHVETGTVDADFGLVVSGTVTDGCFPPIAYCPGAPSSVSSTGAGMGSIGSTSVAANDLTLFCSFLPPNENGIFYYGESAISVPFGDGTRCVGGQVFRLPVLTSSIFGEVFYDLDYTSPPSAAGQILAGATWFFQYWYRDPLGPGGTAFNLSNALEIRFCD